MIGNFNDETNFPNKLLLGKLQAVNFRKDFANNSSANIKLSKTELSKIIHSSGFIDRLLGPLLKTGFALIKNVLQSLGKSFLISLGLTAGVSTADPEILRKNSWIGDKNIGNSKNINERYYES